MIGEFSGTLSEYEAKQVLQDAGVPTVHDELAGSAEQAQEYANEIGYPVVLKVDSPQLQHKTDIDAVMVAHDAEEVEKRYNQILENVDAAGDIPVNGVLVEEHRSGHELIVGVSVDPDFGHVLMFGLGGIFVEVLHDVHFRAVPITEHDARALLDELETRQLLEGARGQEPADTDAIIEVMLQVSNLVDEHPEIQELDINPLFVDADGAVAADAAMTIAEDEV